LRCLANFLRAQKVVSSDGLRMTDRGITRPLVLTVEPACTFASSEISAFHRLDVVKICSDYSSNYDQSTTADLLIAAPGYLGYERLFWFRFVRCLPCT